MNENLPKKDYVPHFELEFFLTMEAFGRIHPSQRCYGQWEQMSKEEKNLHIRDIADLHVMTAKRFNHAGILFHTPNGWKEADIRRSVEEIRNLSGMDFLVMLQGDATYSIPNGEEMTDFVMRLTNQPQKMKDNARRNVDDALIRGRRILQWGTVDGFCLCSDYCFNDNPFLSPAMFDEFITPYLIQLVAGYREMGFYVIKHTDGNIMPILDAIISANPHALHSLDPQGGINLDEVKKRVGNKVCLIGNVNCALLQSGTVDEVEKDIRRTLRQGMPGGGFVFGTSNCIYTGLSLARYELMLKIWRKEGNYDNDDLASSRNETVIK